MIDGSQLVIYLIYWAGFGLIHSLTARPEFKQIIPLQGRAYRLFYNIISLVTLGWVILNVPSFTNLFTGVTSLSLPEQVIFYVLMTLGVIILVIGLLAWNLGAFIGITEESDELKTHGIFAFARHPVYTGILVIFLSTLVIEISTASLSWVLGAGGYFVVGTIFEEQNLSTYFEQYGEYRRNVGRFFPWRSSHFSYLKSNLSSTK